MAHNYIHCRECGSKMRSYDGKIWISVTDELDDKVEICVSFDCPDCHTDHYKFINRDDLKIASK